MLAQGTSCRHKRMSCEIQSDKWNHIAKLSTGSLQKTDLNPRSWKGLLEFFLRTFAHEWFLERNFHSGGGSDLWLSTCLLNCQSDTESHVPWGYKYWGTHLHFSISRIYAKSRDQAKRRNYMRKYYKESPPRLQAEVSDTIRKLRQTRIQTWGCQNFRPDKTLNRKSVGSVHVHSTPTKTAIRKPEKPHRWPKETN